MLTVKPRILPPQNGFDLSAEKLICKEVHAYFLKYLNIIADKLNKKYHINCATWG